MKRARAHTQLWTASINMFRMYGGTFLNGLAPTFLSSQAYVFTQEENMQSTENFECMLITVAYQLVNGYRKGSMAWCLTIIQ